MQNQHFSSADLQRMREILAAADTDTSIQEYDPNNPPKVPYTHQAFPRIVYHGTHKHKTVHNHEQLTASLEAGYSLEPVAAPVVEPAVTLTAADLAEVAALNKQLASKKK